MPQMDGHALVDALRERPELAGMKIVALSALPARTVNQRNFDDYLAKPIEPAMLIEAIATVMEQK